MKSIFSKTAIILFFIVTSLLGGYITFKLYDYEKAIHLKNREDVFREKTEAFSVLFKANLSTLDDVLRGVRGFIEASDYVTKVEWSRYVDSLEMDTDSLFVTSVFFVRYIKDNEKNDFISETRKTLPDYVIWPANGHNVYAPVIYIRPDEMKNYLGFDLFSDLQHKEIMEQSAKDKQLMTMHYIQSGIKDKVRDRFILMRPVFKNNMLYGWVMCGVNLKSMINKNYDITNMKEINFKVYEGNKEDENNLVLAKVITPINDPDFSNTINVPFGSVNLLFHFTSGASYSEQFATYYPSFIVLLVPLSVLGGLLFIWYIIRKKTTLEKEEEIQLQESKQSFAILESILNSVKYAIIYTKADGTIQLFNQGAEKMLGFTAEEMIGKQTPEVFHDNIEMLQRAQELSRILNKPVKPGFDVFVELAKKGIPDERVWTYIRKDKVRISVLLCITAVKDKEGHLIGYVGIANEDSVNNHNTTN